MTFVRTVAETEATGAVAEMYDGDRSADGRVPNTTKAFSLRPDVYAAWLQLGAAIRANMDLRRYELATIAAARRLRSSYCMLAHGSVLIDRFMEADQVRELADDFESADLDPLDLAVMALADKVTADATSVTEGDIERLRRLGCSDEEIVDIVLAAALRCFFSKTLDGLGVQADAKYSGLEPGLRDALTVGRPIAAELTTAGGVGRSVDRQEQFAEPEPVSGQELAAADAYAVDGRAVGRAEIPEHPLAVAEAQLRVPSRHGRVDEHHVAVRAATEQKLLLLAAPIERQQRHLPLAAARPPRRDRADRRVDGLVKPPSPRPALVTEGQVTDQSRRVDHAAREQLIKPQREGVLAEEAIRVGRVQGTGDLIAGRARRQH